jgi:hypothetical protein
MVRRGSGWRHNENGKLESAPVDLLHAEDRALRRRKFHAAGIFLSGAGLW